MRISNSYYFNACKFVRQLLLVLLCCLLLACNIPNDVKQILPAESNSSSISPLININTASAADLEKLPHIGSQKARAIVEHREHFGRFRKPEHLLLIRGISDKKFREIKNLIAVE